MQDLSFYTLFEDRVLRLERKTEDATLQPTLKPISPKEANIIQSSLYRGSAFAQQQQQQPPRYRRMPPQSFDTHLSYSQTLTQLAQLASNGGTSALNNRVKKMIFTRESARRDCSPQLRVHRASTGTEHSRWSTAQIERESRKQIKRLSS